MQWEKSKEVKNQKVAEKADMRYVPIYLWQGRII